MSENSQFDLAVIGNEQRRALVSHEGLSYGATLLTPCGDILQVRPLHRQPARGCPGLVHTSVQPAILIHKFQQRINIGRSEFVEFPEEEQLLDDLMLIGQLLEN